MLALGPWPATAHAQCYSADFAGSTTIPHAATCACVDMCEVCMLRGKRQEQKQQAAQYEPMGAARVCVSTKVVACGTKGGKNAYVVRPARSTSSC